jgi:sterol desaturase/sphingolipid hydroxylase (fatty acid hydroxylase superfamily)
MLSLSLNTETVIVFVLFDIWMYFWHMANHRIAFLWRFHRAHHADIEMDTTTALRFHPGELVLSTFIRLPVVTLLGMSFAQLLLFEVLLNLSTLFHHSNLAVSEKWDRLIRTVMVTPNMHRVHHSVERVETNSNFTSLLSVWDRLYRTFGTRGDTRTITIGLPEYRAQRWQQLWGFLITPFSEDRTG